MLQLINKELFEKVAAGAAASPRKRLNHNFHSGPNDNPHRFLNVLLRGTYIRPHRHLHPPKAETFLVLEGQAALLTLTDAGEVMARCNLSQEPANGSFGVDVAAGVWHTVVALTERVICFEVKPGPWEPSSDKEFAPWSPTEGSPSCAAYVETLASANVGAAFIRIVES
jgi:cupin fold WbuC family metalloprotein